MTKTYRLSQIGILSAAKLAFVIYLVFGFFVAIFGLIAALADGGSEAAQTFGLSSIFVLLLYPAMGFAGAALCCWIYNVIAGRFGGLECQFEEVGDPLPHPLPAYPQPPPPPAD